MMLGFGKHKASDCYRQRNDGFCKCVSVDMEGGGTPVCGPRCLPSLWPHVLSGGGYPSLWSHVLSRGYTSLWCHVLSGGYPSLAGGGGAPGQGYPLGQDRTGVPPPGTGYTAGGMPLAVSRRQWWTWGAMTPPPPPIEFLDPLVVQFLWAFS